MRCVETSRLHLRPFTGEDLDDLSEILDKPGTSFDGETTVFGIHVAQHSLRREEFRPDDSAYEMK